MDLYQLAMLIFHALQTYNDDYVAKSLGTVAVIVILLGWFFQTVRMALFGVYMLVSGILVGIVYLRLEQTYGADSTLWWPSLILSTPKWLVAALFFGTTVYLWSKLMEFLNGESGESPSFRL